MDSDHRELWLSTGQRIRAAHVAHQEGSRLADDTYLLFIWGKQSTFLVSSVCMCACSCVCHRKSTSDAIPRVLPILRFETSLLLVLRAHISSPDGPASCRDPPVSASLL